MASVLVLLTPEFSLIHDAVIDSRRTNAGQFRSDHSFIHQSTEKDVARTKLFAMLDPD